jgi:hypothetical protein
MHRAARDNALSGLATVSWTARGPECTTRPPITGQTGTLPTVSERAADRKANFRRDSLHKRFPIGFATR